MKREVLQYGDEETANHKSKEEASLLYCALIKSSYQVTGN